MTKKEVAKLYLDYKKAKKYPSLFMAGMKHALVLLNIKHNEIEKK